MSTPIVNTAGPANCWRVVYDVNTKVVKQVFLTSGITKTKNGLWAGATIADENPSTGIQPVGTITASAGYAAAIAQIASMGLTYVPTGGK